MSIPGLRSFQPPSQAARAVSGNLQSLQGQGYCFIDVVSGWSNTTDGNRTLIISGVSVQHLVLLGLDWSYGGFTSNQQGRQHSLQQDSNGKIVLVLHPSTSACSLKELLPLLLGCVPENFGPVSPTLSLLLVWLRRCRTLMGLLLASMPIWALQLWVLVTPAIAALHACILLLQRSALDAITFLQVYCPGTLELPSPYHQFMMHHLTAQLLNSKAACKQLC